MRSMAAALVLLVASAGSARGQAFPPIEDRDFALDLYSGAALGSVRIVGMGGTAVATAEGSAGTLANPASAAVRLTTSKGSWDWDFHLDALSAAFASDFDNNGVSGVDEFGTTLETFGLAGMLEGWGLAAVGTSESTVVRGQGTDAKLIARTERIKLAIAKEFLDRAFTVGAAIKIGAFELDEEIGGRSAALFGMSGGGLELGGLWRPPGSDLRVGATVAFPVTGREVDTGGCDPDDCEGYILPERIGVPWEVAAGVAWRIAPTRWNQQVATDYRDERAVLLAADLVLTGPVADGHGLEAFGQQQLQRSGRKTVASLRLGAEYEWLPGRLRLRGGTYWEPGRFTGIDGRLHATLGVELSLFQFSVWRWTFRARVSVTGDIAVRYGNAGVSIGLWH